MLVPVLPLLSGSPLTESGPVGSHHFMLALETSLYGDVVAMTARIRKGKKPLIEAAFQKDIEIENNFSFKETVFVSL